MTKANDPIRQPMDSAALILSRSYYERRTRMRDHTVSFEERRKVLRQAIGDATGGSVDSMLSLRMAVECFTADLRDSGMMPETALLALKAIVRERRDITGEMMREQISNWCIEEFFDPLNPGDLRVTLPTNGVS